MRNVLRRGRVNDGVKCILRTQPETKGGIENIHIKGLLQGLHIYLNKTTDVIVFRIQQG